MNKLINKPKPGKLHSFGALVMGHYTDKTKRRSKKEINLVDVLKGAIVTVPFGTGMSISH